MFCNAQMYLLMGKGGGGIDRKLIVESISKIEIATCAIFTRNIDFNLYLLDNVNFIKQLFKI